MGEQRNFGRIPFRRPVSYDSVSEVKIDGGHKVIKGGSLANDLSEGGLRSTVDKFVPLNTSLILNFAIDPRNSVQLEGKVVWVQKVPNGENYQIGMKFVDSGVNFESKEAIKKLFENQN